MQGFIHEHRGPLLGAAGLHLGLLAVATLAGLQWVKQPPPVQLAIQAVVVDASALPRSMRQPAPNAAPRAMPEAAPPPVEQPAVAEQRETPKPVPDQRQMHAEAQERAKAQAEAKAVADAKAAADAKAVAEAKAVATAERKRAADAEAAMTAKRAEDAAAKAAERKKAQALEQRASQERETKLQADREAELQRRLAAEDAEAAGDRATAGVLDEYRAALIQAIERNWIRPPTARSGLQCELRVNQAVGGTVLDVRLGDCNGDEAVRESIVNAVYRASPLPAPRDARVFERRLVINFQPTE